MLNPPRRASLDKNMPPVMGWNRLKPLPEKFTALPDPKWRSRKRRRILINPAMEPLIDDGRPVFIDLFAGCGGFSLGLIKAGWRCIASVEWEYWSHVTFCSNLPHIQGAPIHIYSCDIRKLSGREILLNAGITKVDCVVGGPPCQSFSTAGKRVIGDKRDNLLWEFARLIKELQPTTWVMENVPGLKSKKFADGSLVFDEFQKFIKTRTAADLQGIVTREVLESSNV